MSQTHSTLSNEQRGSQHTISWKLQKPASVTQGTGFPHYRTEATCNWLWQSSRMRNRRDRKINLLNALTQLWNAVQHNYLSTSLEQKSLISLQTVFGYNIEQKGNRAGISDYSTSLIYTDVSGFNSYQR